MSSKDADLVVSKMAQYEDIFVSMMLSEEIGLQLPDEDDGMLLTDSFVMFLSFACLGALPLLVFFLGPMELLGDERLFVSAVAVSSLVLFILGSMKSSFSSASWFYAGFEALMHGLVCSITAYFIGSSIVNLIAFI
jgi:VIT1/CCC1 family predicted Fe2+/Mn2+ transporter